MNRKSGTSKDAADKLVRGIKRKTRKHCSAGEKIGIVLAGLRGADSIAALCRQEGMAESLYSSWSKELLEAGKNRLAGDTARQATAPEVKERRSEALALREVVAELVPENRLLEKKHLRGWGGRSEASGCNQATVVQKPRLLSDNGSSYVAADLAEYLEDKGMDHVRGAPHHPQTQGKIARWHQTMKNRVLLENDFLPGDLERQIGAFVDHDNNHRYHESIGNLTPADVYHGRGAKIRKMREKIKKHTSRKRRLQHQSAAA